MSGRSRPTALPLLPLAGAPEAAPGIYAEVAVEAGGLGVDRLFTYRVPSALAARVLPGARVRVPFAGRPEPVAGVVFATTSTSALPAERLRPIAEAPDEGPLLAAADLELARWLAADAVCSLAQAARMLLPPPGAPPRAAAAYAPAPEAPPDAAERLRRAPAQLQAWEAVRASPGVPVADLRRRGIRPAALAALVRRGWLTVGPAAPPEVPRSAAQEPGTPPVPTEAQARALGALVPALQAPESRAFLLWGVTGSGKTEVYLGAIAAVLRAGRQAIVLVPEISLTPQTVALFRRRFPGAVAVLHSALGTAERQAEWWRIRRGEAAVVVGARSAVFAPCPRLGLIVVDEEHEPSYKQEESPRYHAREVARRRAALAGVPLLLGSATPDVATWEAAARGACVRLDLPVRVGGRPLPQVRVVDMCRPPDAGGTAVRRGEPELFGADLLQAMERHLGGGRQVLLFLNRRGFAPVLLCAACGFVARCQACDVALCYHDADRTLRCHYCGARRAVPRSCPRCEGLLLRLRGSGTERVAQEVARRFPAARVLRMDLDVTSTRGAHARVYEAFRSGQADVLVGTQMVAKGWDVAGVTLVGVVDADTGLHHPEYRGAERTFQLLCQVAGRAGRGDVPGEVVLQTHTPEHFAVRAAAVHDYEAFARQELEARRAAGFPPFASLLRLLSWAPAAADARRGAEALGEALRAELPAGVDLWGPAPAPLERLRGQVRWHLCLRGPDGGVLRGLARSALAAAGPRSGAARLAADPDPQSML